MIENTVGKEKLFITSNFSCSYSVFKRFILQIHKIQGLFGKGLTLWLLLDHMSNALFKRVLQILWKFYTKDKIGKENDKENTVEKESNAS